MKTQKEQVTDSVRMMSNHFWIWKGIVAKIMLHWVLYNYLWDVSQDDEKTLSMIVRILQEIERNE